MNALLLIKTLNKKLKLRYFAFTYITILLFVTLPGVLNLFPEWAPYGSIRDTTQTGFSQLATALKDQGYVVDRTVEPLETLKLEQTTALVFPPESPPNSQDMNYLKERMKRGLPTFYLGKLVEISMDMFGVSLQTCRVFKLDSNNTYSIAHVPVKLKDTNETFVSIIPAAFSFYSETSAEALLIADHSWELCNAIYEEKYPDPKNNVVALQDRNQFLIADEYMLKNNFTSLYPQNLNLFESIVISNGLNIRKFVFYERNLVYIPVNQEGLRMTIEKQSPERPFIIFTYIFVFVLFAASFFTGLFGSTSTFETAFKQKLTRRMESLHTDRIPAVPLSIEEDQLIKEQFLMREYGADYYSKIAIDNLQFIDEEGLERIIPKKLYQSLVNLATNQYDTETALTILEKTRYVLDLIEKHPLFVQGIIREKEREISIFDLPTFSTRSSIAIDTKRDYFEIPYEETANEK